MKSFGSMNNSFEDQVRIARNYLGAQPPIEYQFVTNCSALDRDQATHHFHPDYLVAEPRRTNRYSVNQLVNMGMVGIYRKSQSDRTQA